MCASQHPPLPCHIFTTSTNLSGWNGFSPVFLSYFFLPPTLRSSNKPRTTDADDTEFHSLNCSVQSAQSGPWSQLRGIHASVVHLAAQAFLSWGPCPPTLLCHPSMTSRHIYLKGQSFAVPGELQSSPQVPSVCFPTLTPETWSMQLSWILWSLGCSE